MATDIAFAVGVLTLLGKRAPPALRVLLLALAVIDDLGAIGIIAAYYSSDIRVHGFFIVAVAAILTLSLQRLGVRAKAIYLVPGFLCWLGVYVAGVHPTIAGVVMGLLTPVRAWFGPAGFVAGLRQELHHLEGSPQSPDDLVGSVRHIEVASREALSPAESLIQSLHPWVAFGVMPIFALANSGVHIGATPGGGSLLVTSSVAAALVLGKPLGVLSFCWLSLKLRLSRLPTGVTGRHLLVLGLVAGIGFTMSLFMAQLAFTQTGLLRAAKLGVLIASGAAAMVSMLVGWLILPVVDEHPGARTADEAEASTEH